MSLSKVPVNPFVSVPPEQIQQPENKTSPQQMLNPLKQGANQTPLSGGWLTPKCPPADDRYL
ncbi:hypothetical protein GCM10011529_31850 [Polymorphobacter glacialis]|uniref:Uncharacterized protein n=1 Tax=Sandarakinorhabdus glacialis TaxID=1614636 RepID=A0A917ECS6_9SPHN|nr:hypothetical protein [Polymorphobacter glacialis]GGE22874.1 hypothetical protein GCM10011529_31850 [Polymorphobacter glacialis]